jgi:hypothetical protein
MPLTTVAERLDQGAPRFIRRLNFDRGTRRCCLRLIERTDYASLTAISAARVLLTVPGGGGRPGHGLAAGVCVGLGSELVVVTLTRRHALPRASRPWWPLRQPRRTRCGATLGGPWQGWGAVDVVETGGRVCLVGGGGIKNEGVRKHETRATRHCPRDSRQSYGAVTRA